MKPVKLCPFKAKNYSEVWNMFTVNNKDTRTGNSLLRRMISQIKSFKRKSFLPFSFATTKICVEIRLAEDGTRIGGV